MRMSTTQIRPLVIAAALGAAACADRGPSESTPTGFDAPRADAGLRAIDSVLGSGAWHSFQALGARFVIGREAAALASPATALTLAREILDTVATGAVRVPRVPPEIRGTTFVIDPATLQYVPDPGRAGAPANGVRYILYALNPLTGDPVPDAEIGHADLTDEGDALLDAVSLHLEVVSGGITFLDYRVTAGGNETAGALAAQGMTTDGETEVVFAVRVTATREGDADHVNVHFDISVPDYGFGARADVRNVSGATGAVGEVAMEVGVDTDAVQFTARHSSQAVDAAFAVNGRPFATVRGDPEDPEIRGADGRPLSRDERRVLHGLMQLTGRVFEMFAALMQPVGALLG